MNPKIERCRQAALAVLKPTKQQLEHGLELHANSLVCEAYGFAPRGSVQPEHLKGAYDIRTYSNAFEQQLNLNFLRDPAQHDESLEAWQASGVNCVFLNAGVEGNVPGELIKRLARFTMLCDQYPEIFQRVVWPEQIEPAVKAGKIAIGFTTCGVPYTHEFAPIEESLYCITVFFQLGVRMMHLTYNRRNLIGDGCGEIADAGLSAFGRQVIAKLNEEGIIVDLAHCGQRTAFEAAEVSSKPVIASHTAVGKLTDHFRAKKDEVIRSIAKTGGYVGICALPRFLHGDGTIKTFLDHIDYVAENFGVDHVAIATDNAYQCGPSFRWDPPFPVHDWFERYKQPFKYSFVETEAMCDTLAWTNWPLFTVGLVQRGYTDDEIRKIHFGNFLRVFKACTDHIPRRGK